MLSSFPTGEEVGDGGSEEGAAPPRNRPEVERLDPLLLQGLGAFSGSCSLIGLVPLGSRRPSPLNTSGPLSQHLRPTLP